MRICSIRFSLRFLCWMSMAKNYQFMLRADNKLPQKWTNWILCCCSSHLQHLWNFSSAKIHDDFPSEYQFSRRSDTRLHVRQIIPYLWLNTKFDLRARKSWQISQRMYSGKKKKTKIPVEVFPLELIIRVGCTWQRFSNYNH